METHWKNILWFQCQCHSTLIARLPLSEQQAINKGKTRKNEIDLLSTILIGLADKTKFPTIPTIVLKIIQVIDDPEKDSNAVAQILKLDPFFAHSVLEMANRAGSTETITKLAHAVTVVGRAQVKNLILAASLLKLRSFSQVLTVQTFWNEAFALGSIAEHIGHEFKVNIEGDLLFIAGVLCNIGKLLTVLIEPHDVDKLLLAEAGEEEKSWLQLETEQRLPKHAVLGECLVAAWNFCSDIRVGVLRHHDFPTTSKGKIVGSIETWHILAFANQLGHRISYRYDRLDKDLLDLFRKHFGLESEESYNQLLQKLKSIVTRSDQMAKDLLKVL